MKIRKAIVAAATALTVASAGTVVANAQDDQLSSNLSSSFTNADEKDNGEGETSSDGSSQKDGESDLANLSSNEDDEPDPDAIKSWIGVFTAVIGVLSAAFGFFATYF